MRVYRIVFSSNEQDDSWMEDPRLCVRTYKPNDVQIYHFAGLDNISSIINAKLFLFDTGHSKNDLNFIIQNFDDRLGFWDSIFEHKLNQKVYDENTN